MYIDMVFLNKNQMSEKPYTLKLSIGGEKRRQRFRDSFFGRKKREKRLQRIGKMA